MYRSGTLATAFMVATTSITHTPKPMKRVVARRSTPRANCIQGIAASNGIILRKLNGAHEIRRSADQ